MFKGLEIIELHFFRRSIEILSFPKLPHGLLAQELEFSRHGFAIEIQLPRGPSDRHSRGEIPPDSLVEVTFFLIVTGMKRRCGEANSAGFAAVPGDILSIGATVIGSPSDNHPRAGRIRVLCMALRAF